MAPYFTQSKSQNPHNAFLALQYLLLTLSSLPLWLYLLQFPTHIALVTTCLLAILRTSQAHFCLKAFAFLLCLEHLLRPPSHPQVYMALLPPSNCAQKSTQWSLPDYTIKIVLPLPVLIPYPFLPHSTYFLSIIVYLLICWFMCAKMMASSSTLTIYLRFLCHSCVPANVAVREFQKILTPFLSVRASSVVMFTLVFHKILY